MLSFLIVKYASDKKEKKEIQMAMLKDQNKQSTSYEYRNRINHDSDDENTYTTLTTNDVNANQLRQVGFDTEAENENFL